MCEKVGEFCKPLDSLIGNLNRVSGENASRVLQNIIKVHMKCLSVKEQKS